jgi:hypothetical protein
MQPSPQLRPPEISEQIRQAVAPAAQEQLAFAVLGYRWFEKSLRGM